MMTVVSSYPPESTRSQGRSKPLQVPLHQFSILVADTRRVQHLRKTRYQTCIRIIYRLLPGDAFLGSKLSLIFVHGCLV